MSMIRKVLSRVFGSAKRPGGARPYAHPKRSPTRTQREICERIGIQIPRDLGSCEVHQLIQRSLEDPEKRSLFDQYEGERNAASEREEREELGSELYEQVKHWEVFSDAGGQYMVTFQRGSTTHLDIVEFDAPDVDPDRRRNPLKVCLLLPRVYKDRDTGDYLEWEREVSLAPEKILAIEKLSPEIDLFDIERYRKLIAQASS